VVSAVLGVHPLPAYLRPIGHREVSEMLAGEMAKYQIEDRIRAAEQDRAASRSPRPSRAGGRAAVVRRVGSGLFAAAFGRRRKTTPTASRVGIPLV
jgi:hypothetical protein